MLTVDARCTFTRCTISNGNIYRMVGYCSNCGTEDILILFSAGHEKRSVDCPVCGVRSTGYSFGAGVHPQRLATEEEIPVG